MNENNLNFKKGDIIKVKIDDLAYGGERVGHYKGIAVFINRGVVGEIVKARIYNRKKNYLKAEFLELVEKSSKRVEPSCDIYENCGGCQLQEIDYEYQLKLKNKIIKDQINKIGELNNLKLNKVIEMDYPWHYRNKAQFPLKENEEGEIMAGFFKRRSHDIVPLDNCPIQHQLINRITQKTLKILNDYQNLSIYDEKEHKGFLRHLIVRVGVCTNQALVAFVTNGKKDNKLRKIAQRIMDKVPELVGVMQNINTKKTNVILGEKSKILVGKNRYRDYISNKKFDISLESFFQTNTLQSEKLYNLALDFADFSGNENLIDCYCGTGSIGLYFANKVDKVIGIDINKEAIKDAKHNKEINNIENAEFMVGDVKEKISKIIENNDKKNMVLVFDPPRKGLDDKIKEILLKKEIKKIIYISCNPSTLARDIKKLKEKYNVKKVQGVDMFPQTYHIESVSLLKRK
ncbi:MAG: 23S rRNA (uracil(1939)-C(5))-methyltransferase RlmD [Bacillota bacterium]